MNRRYWNDPGPTILTPLGWLVVAGLCLFAAAVAVYLLRAVAR